MRTFIGCTAMLVALAGIVAEMSKAIKTDTISAKVIICTTIVVALYTADWAFQ
jgi:hypothetical protein